jgi:hypothetical protein
VDAIACRGERFAVGCKHCTVDIAADFGEDHQLLARSDFKEPKVPVVPSGAGNFFPVLTQRDGSNVLLQLEPDRP